MMGNLISGMFSSFYPVPTSGHLFMILRSFLWHSLTKFSMV